MSEVTNRRDPELDKSNFDTHSRICMLCLFSLKTEIGNKLLCKKNVLKLQLHIIKSLDKINSEELVE
jgi:hypothetical protein